MEATAKRAFTFCGASPSDNRFCEAKSDVLVDNLCSKLSEDFGERFIARKNVPVEQTWNLNALYPTTADFEEAKKRLAATVDDLKIRYESWLSNPITINACLKEYREILKQISDIDHYVELGLSVDQTESSQIKEYQKTSSFLAEIKAKLSFIDTEILLQPAEVLEEAAKDAEHRLYLQKLLKKKPHMLSKEAEAVIKNLSPALGLPYRMYDTVKFGDIHFKDIEYKGKKHSLTYNTFEGHLELEADTKLRRRAFKRFSKGLAKYQHTTAGLYNAQVTKEKTLANLRGYHSVFDFLLDDQEVSRVLYDRQIDIIMSDLAPHMRKYAKLLQKVHKLKQMTYADLKIDIDPNFAPSVTYDKAKAYILDGLSVLGEDYAKILKDAFEQRWIDYAENTGKSTGAFCASPYGHQSYILLSFNHKMNEVLTLAHELGHAGHFQMANNYQNILNADCSIYFVEAPSTTNEIIMENYLLKQAKDDRMKRWVLSQMVSKTYYHNFVTHLLEAAYQREVYKIIDAGGSVQADTLNNIYKKVLTDFWGDSIELTEGAELTWMRQPHYYMGLYSYTYSAGLTIGTQIARKILDEPQVAENWLKVLSLGGTKSSEELAQIAGVDITTDAPLKDTIAYIGSLIDEMEVLSKKLGDI
ncbi:oligoendopeptidase F [Clostridiales bacterium COT073_COT-073]|nr:oligoendopeptidase F [Clostridiales bacterium COT073_COT-073]